jgi:hypothetical protein
MTWVLILVSVASLTIRVVAGKAAFISLLLTAGIAAAALIGIVIIGFLFGLGFWTARLWGFEDES